MCIALPLFLWGLVREARRELPVFPCLSIEPRRTQQYNPHVGIRPPLAIMVHGGDAMKYDAYDGIAS